MASRKDLKRDIDCLISDLISDCLLYMDIYPDKAVGEVTEIINSVLLKKQEVFAGINTPTSKMAKKEVKDAYKKNISEMLNCVNAGYEKLSKLPRK